MTGDVAPVKHMKCVVNGTLEDEYRKKCVGQISAHD